MQRGITLTHCLPLFSVGLTGLSSASFLRLESASPFCSLKSPQGRPPSPLPMSSTSVSLPPEFSSRWVVSPSSWGTWEKLDSWSHRNQNQTRFCVINIRAFFANLDSFALDSSASILLFMLKATNIFRNFTRYIITGIWLVICGCLSEMSHLMLRTEWFHKQIP